MMMMMEAAVACVSGWLTPTVLFLLLNLVIGIIAVTSKFAARHHADTPAAAWPHTHALSRSSSIVLDRLRSFNLYSYRAPDPPAADTATVPQPETLQCDPEPEPEPEVEAEAEAEHHHIARIQSDTKPAAGEIPTKLAKKMKKSATMKSAFNHFEFEAEDGEEIETPKRPATMREREKEEDAEVDAKADDFINRFRQQLKLQRLDSIIRYKEMLNRGN